MISVRWAKRCGPVLLCFVIAFSVSAPAVSADDGPFVIRSQNPFTRVFGLPMYPSTATTRSGQWDGLLVFDIVNHADSGDDADETVVLDGETYIANAIVSFGLTDRWQLGADVPYVWYSAGRMDGFLENWHDLFSISNNNRGGPEDELLISYMRDQAPVYVMTEANSGIGDVRVWATYELMDRGEGRTRIVTRATLKLPTGDSDDLHGSGAADLAWDVAVRHTLYEGRTSVSLSAHVGVLALGNGDVLADYQEDIVPYGGIGIVWHIAKHMDLMAQIYGQASYFDSDLDALGASSVQLTAGVRYGWPNTKVELLLGLAQDLFADTTPDIAFHFELRKVFAR